MGLLALVAVLSLGGQATGPLFTPDTFAMELERRGYAVERNGPAGPALVLGGCKLGMSYWIQDPAKLNAIYRVCLRQVFETPIELSQQRLDTWTANHAPAQPHLGFHVQVDGRVRVSASIAVDASCTEERLFGDVASLMESCTAFQQEYKAIPAIGWRKSVIDESTKLTHADWDDLNILLGYWGWQRCVI
jgi:hypothetical protein